MGKTTHINLVKLCVGADTVEDLANWQAHLRALHPGRPPHHVTRMWPKRSADLLNGGSLYWVIKGVIQVRQKIVDLQEVRGEDGIRRCAIVLDDTLAHTQPAPRRAFQGWRYLTPQDAPADLPQTRATEDPLPPELSAALADIGVL